LENKGDENWLNKGLLSDLITSKILMQFFRISILGSKQDFESSNVTPLSRLTVGQPLLDINEKLPT